MMLKAMRLVKGIVDSELILLWKQGLRYISRLFERFEGVVSIDLKVSSWCWPKPGDSRWIRQ